MTLEAEPTQRCQRVTDGSKLEFFSAVGERNAGENN